MTTLDRGILAEHVAAAERSHEIDWQFAIAYNAAL